jgi:hypothetical protein
MVSTWEREKGRLAPRDPRTTHVRSTRNHLQPKMPTTMFTRSRAPSPSPLFAGLLSRPLLALRKARRYLADELTGSYRPEKHYMRGPGPKWREKAGSAALEGGRHATEPR